MNIPTHIRLDIAIETIGKVIAVYNKKFGNDPVEFKKRYTVLNQEIQDIYSSKDIEFILQKVDEVYIPFLQKELNFTPKKLEQITPKLSDIRTVHA